MPVLQAYSFPPIRLSQVRMKKIDVGFTSIDTYQPEQIGRQVDRLFQAVGFKPVTGDHIVLKPNLVAPSRLNDLACTHPQFVEGVAAWFLDHGCRVRVGDSPASGSCAYAMDVQGLSGVVQKLGLEIAPFQKTVPVRLDGGVKVAVCCDALECDHLINLPKVKSHALVRVTLAVKNYFGIVKGWRKAMTHQIHGGGDGASFIDIICDLPKVVPGSVSLCDGITAMHVTGPMGGKPFALNMMGCSTSPVALDAGLLAVLGIDPAVSPLWCRFDQRSVFGNNVEDLNFPLLKPQDIRCTGFIVPAHLNSIRFDLTHVAGSVFKRLKLRCGL